MLIFVGNPDDSSIFSTICRSHKSKGIVPDLLFLEQNDMNCSSFRDSPTPGVMRASVRERNPQFVKGSVKQRGYSILQEFQILSGFQRILEEYIENEIFLSPSRRNKSEILFIVLPFFVRSDLVVLLE
ncbi:hypothetical protein CEXT_195271 [Caerostris extrusa]|uniref:Maturase K n=1 Tax=Caerostris extrusa TaxID=172846 RepID=A0AAV4NXH6_CAEEX|nr:hypothetical protein CEXT_195271 [Caerostris extrusa]